MRLKKSGNKKKKNLKIFEFIMKKYFFLVFVAIMCVACNSDFEEVYSQHEKLLVSKNEKKKDPNFLIHNDHYQKGKEETK